MATKIPPIRLFIIVLVLVLLGVFTFSSVSNGQLKGNLKNASVGNVQHFDNH